MTYPMNRQGWLILAATVLAAGCRTSRTAIEERSLSVSHASEERIEVRTERQLVRDTVWVEVPAAQDELVTADSVSHLMTDFAESTARILPDGRLLHTLRQRDGLRKAVAEVPVTVRESTIVRRDSTAMELRERKEEKVQKKAVPMYLRIIGVMLAICAVAAITRYFIRKRG